MIISRASTARSCWSTCWARWTGARDAVGELERAMDGVLNAFRPGANSWLVADRSGGRSTSVLFAATKADHLPASSHDRLDAILKHIVDDARAARRDRRRRRFTRWRSRPCARRAKPTAKQDGETLPCLKGMPLKGERIGDVTFDGVEEAAIFPGDLPADPARGPRARPAAPSRHRLNSCALPAAEAADTIPMVKAAAFPHIRLDRALDFLISDYLA